MVRSVLVLLLPTFFLCFSAASAARSNQDFCIAGVDSLAASIASDLNAGDFLPLIVSEIEGRFGDVLRSRLAARLTGSGRDVYLDTQADRSGKYLLQSTINECSLKFVGRGGNAFHQGKVVREFALSAAVRLLEQDGKLAREFATRSVILSDTLTFEQARRARGNELFLSPELPPTTFQRLVEPGIIAGVTGVLVYLFFASR